MKDVLIVISSNPNGGYLYEQGIEVALNLADAMTDVTVLAEGEFLRNLDNSDTNIFTKKLKQCELYDIEVYAEDCRGIEFIREITEQNFACTFTKVVTF